MSECVVRMEMPTRCDFCDFWRVCKNVADFGKARYFEEPRELTVGMKGCRIVCQLPEGHGRLADKDEMLKKIENYHRYMTIGRESDPRCIIEDSPTIVPEEAERSENEAESQSPKPTDPVPIRDVYYVMTECDVKTGTVTYEPRERIEL